ncbi:MAG TPA: UDP-N-acetylmuramoyl-L-alanine--D-glutamate ligase [Kineosporiaceae bacterium]|nr:UDP-N-acetylmuramoyl-L-alanine--D-glutamate ligase [Kineosporiaceae bacterium]
MTPNWPGLRVVVAGIGVSGFAAADALLERGAKVVVIDPRQEQSQRERGIVLDTLGADIRLGPDAVEQLPMVAGEPAELLVISPGWDDAQPVVRAALAAGIPIWGEAELAWRLRPATGAAPWLSITGTRGKATTATMLAAMLTAAGYRATAIGQAGTSLLEAVLHPRPYDVLAVQLSGFQLRWASSLQPQSSVCLNVSGTDLDDGSLASRGRVYQNTELACVYNTADPATEQLVMDAEVIEGCRAIGFTLGVPAVSMVGLVEDVLCDRAFVAERITSAAELGTLDDVRVAGAGVLAAHNIANALAAATLARGFGVRPADVRDGLRGYRPLAHHLTPIDPIDPALAADQLKPGEVTWVDDSAATDPMAAAAGLATFERVVWVAGGALEPTANGDRIIADLDRLVAAHRSRLRAVVLFGPDRAVLREALQRHAPDVPVVDVDVAETEQVMEVVVARAGQLAQPGDTVLLSPGFGAEPFATLDQRGVAFGRAVRGRAEP